MGSGLAIADNATEHDTEATVFRVSHKTCHLHECTLYHLSMDEDMSPALDFGNICLHQKFIDILRPDIE